MTEDQFIDARSDLQGVLSDAGFTDATVEGSWNGCEAMAMASVVCLSPAELQYLTLLICRSERP
jgi:hypothetical protein